MYQVRKIRVIKRNTGAEPAASVIKAKRSAAPDIASTVATWVRDLRVRKGSDRKLAIEKFFATMPQSGKL